MSNLPAKRELPKLSDLIEDTELSLKENAFLVLVNQEPPSAWLAEHPMIKGYKYLPVQRVEWLMTRIFGTWKVIVKDTKILANSVCVTITVTVTNPVTGEQESQDGVGACPIQTDKGSGAMDWNAAKADGVMKALPAARSYAFKDACENWGKIFGKDLGRKDAIGYDSLLKEKTDIFEQLTELYELKKDSIPANEFKRITEIIETREFTSYQKTLNFLKNL